jgi:hypothetical protein
MDQLLDIDEIIKENKRQESNRLGVFEGLLVNCHKTIQKNNSKRIREMNYTIPAFVFGKPKFNIDVLRNYIVVNLRDNGLRVEILDRHHIYISWKETDIDLERYMNRKTQIDNRHSSMYMTNGTNGEMRGIRPAIDRDARHRFEMMKFRQDRQRQINTDRQHRFDQQKQRFQIPEMDNYYGR